MLCKQVLFVPAPVRVEGGEREQVQSVPANQESLSLRPLLVTLILIANWFQETHPILTTGIFVWSCCNKQQKAHMHQNASL